MSEWLDFFQPRHSAGCRRGASLLRSIAKQSGNTDHLVRERQFFNTLLVEAESGTARIRVLQCFLEERMHQVAAPNRLAGEALCLMLQSQGAVSVAELAQHCGCSARRLHQICVETTGLAPKQLARIARAQHLLHVLVSSAKLTDAAMAAGFFDHPHLVRECRALFGCAPGELTESLRGASSLDPVLRTNRRLISTGLALTPRTRQKGCGSLRVSARCAP